MAQVQGTRRWLLGSAYLIGIGDIGCAGDERREDISGLTAEAGANRQEVTDDGAGVVDEAGAAQEGAPEECRSPCPVDRACDDTVVPEEFSSLEATRSAWEAECGDRVEWLVGGECDDGTRLLRVSYGFVGEIQFFDDSGEFVWRLTDSDDASGVCWGRAYWPEYRTCENPVVTEAICGDGLDVGSIAFRDRWATQ